MRVAALRCGEGAERKGRVMRMLRSERGQTSAEYLGVLVFLVAVMAVVLQSAIGERLAAEVRAQVAAIAEGGSGSGAEPALARPAANLYDAQARPALAAMNAQGTQAVPLAARPEREGDSASPDAGQLLGVLLSPPGLGKLSKGGELLPFEDELKAVVDELTGQADAERALAALAEGRYGQALASGLMVLPFLKPVKAAKWLGKGLQKVRGGPGRGLWRRVKDAWRKLGDERGSVGLPGGGKKGAGRPNKDFAGTPGERVPPYAGKGKAQGVLDGDSGRQLDLTSGRAGAAARVPKGTPGFDAYLRTHVEGHAAAEMREKGIDRATLYINKVPCPNCDRNLPKAVPKGAELTVRGPGGFKKTYRGAR